MNKSPVVDVRKEKVVKQKNVCVIGLGYIGLPTALLLAAAGNRVLGVDLDTEKLRQLNQQKLPFDEPGLSALYDKVFEKGTFHIDDHPDHANFYIIAVPTPHQGKKTDLKYVLTALETLEHIVKKSDCIIVESTVAPQDFTQIIVPLIKKWSNACGIAHCPERAIPGETLHEMIHNDRIVGALNPSQAEAVKSLYQTFVKGEIFTTSLEVAAACKVMENTYRAVNIALANEFAERAEELDFDVWEAIRLANRHPRVEIHSPGPGVGGHCIPIDPWFFVPSKSNSLIETALKVNERASQRVAEEVTAAISRLKIQNPVVGILGYAYKKDVDDVRDTPAEAIRTRLQAHVKVMVHDPYVRASNFSLDSLEKFAQDANVLVLVTDHTEYSSLRISAFPKVRLLFDTRSFFSNKNLQGYTGEYRVLGKGG